MQQILQPCTGQPSYLLYNVFTLMWQKFND